MRILKMNFPDFERIVYGVDFSGARDAGRKIWIARGIIEEAGLFVTECFQAKDLPDSGEDRERSHRALREFVNKQKNSIFGMDFPFGLPKTLVKEGSWEEWLLAFKDRYTSPEQFRGLCTVTSGGKELKRLTDVEKRTPFSPYNLRLFRQAFFGIKDVLGPLMRDRAVNILPMQKPGPGKSWVIETCPASTLKKERLSSPYKGEGEKKRGAREKILRCMQNTGILKIKKSALRCTIIDDRGGDALDSVIAAFATFRALRGGITFEKNSPYALEGWVYV
jgi:hypothetical protein